MGGGVAVSYGAIRNKEKYAEAAARRRTERFNHCFPRNISLADIDSHVEINHHWLFIEWKTGDQEVSAGQMKDLRRLASRPRMSTWVVWTTEDGFITHAQRLPSGARRAVTEDQIAQAIRAWVEEVERAPAPTQLDIALDKLAVIARIDALRAQLMLDVIHDIGGAV